MRFNSRVTCGARFGRSFASLLALLCALLLAPSALVVQAQTAGGTQIVNRASATYSDGTTTYSALSNPVTVVVANVSGLAITPDGVSNPSVVSGQTDVDFVFTVTNTSNFGTQVRFLQMGGSIVPTGPVTLQLAGIDANGDNTIDSDNDGVIDAGDVDILSNPGNVSYPSAGTVARNASFRVIVRADVNAAAAAGAAINIRLGDATGGAPSYDNQAVAAANLGTAKVRTDSGASAPVNGESEARGDISTTVQTDAQLRVTLGVPAGPVALGSNITYNLSVQNTGLRDARQQTLQGAPAAVQKGIFVVVPIPAGTTFQSFAALPAGVTVLYSTSPLGADPAVGVDPPASGPLSAAVTWTTTAPGVLSNVTRVAFNVTDPSNPAAVLAVGQTVAGLGVNLQVQSNINASNPLYGIAEAFARNNVNSPITDQSDKPGNEVSNKGDGNANFNEPKVGVPPAADDPISLTKGYQQPTTLTPVGAVLMGPQGQPAAVGPNPGASNNNDYTNKTVSPAAIAGVEPGGGTAVASTVDFVNTVQNTGNANDVFTFSLQSALPPGFTVLISTDGGANFTNVATASLAIAFGGQANIVVRVGVPAGATVLTATGVVLRAHSTNTATSTNDTIDRVYTGFLRLDKTVTVINNTGVGNGPSDPGADDAVPGAELEYTITYTNISSTGGTGNATLTASSVTIREDGTPSASNPSNWGATTTQVVGSAVDPKPGASITGDTAGSILLIDNVGTLLPGESGSFKFRRRIN
ncbi:MAG TPA: hypothetical protein VGB73_17165 [Pyrinomonadaceae bacterium]